MYSYNLASFFDSLLYTLKHVWEVKAQLACEVGKVVA
jgi:hypothetical protein